MTNQNSNLIAVAAAINNHSHNTSDFTKILNSEFFTELNNGVIVKSENVNNIFYTKDYTKANEISEYLTENKIDFESFITKDEKICFAIEL